MQQVDMLIYVCVWFFLDKREIGPTNKMVFNFLLGNHLGSKSFLGSFHMEGSKGSESRGPYSIKSKGFKAKLIFFRGEHWQPVTPKHWNDKKNYQKCFLKLFHKVKGGEVHSVLILIVKHNSADLLSLFASSLPYCPAVQYWELCFNISREGGSEHLL